MTRKRGRQKPMVTALLGIAWLGVVFASVFLVLTRRAEYGVYVYIVPCMAIFMLIIFVTSFLPRKTQDLPLTEVLGRISVIALICIVLVVLGYAIIKAHAGILVKGVFILFFVTFVRILMDYIRHCQNRQCLEPKKPRGEFHESPQDDS